MPEGLALKMVLSRPGCLVLIVLFLLPCSCRPSCLSYPCRLTLASLTCHADLTKLTSPVFPDLAVLFQLQATVALS